MKKISIFLTLIASAMMFVGCQKEFNGILTAKIEKYNGNDGKVYINNNYACWSNDDAIAINGTSATINTTTNPATIHVAEGTTINNGITAIFPASYAVGDQKKYKFPKIQEYQVDANNRQKVMAPMVAYANKGSSELTFKNAGALIHVTVKNNQGKDILLRRIELTGSTPLWGTITYTQESNGEPTMPSTITNSANDANTIALVIPDNVELTNDAEKTFYIAVPAVTTKLTPTIYYSTKGSTTATDLNQNYNFSCTGALAGPLTIQRNKIDIMDLGHSQANMPTTGTATTAKWIGAGTENDPYLVYNNVDFRNIPTRQYLYFNQMADFELYGNTVGVGTFSGIYDGNNNTIIARQGDNKDGVEGGGIFKSLSSTSHNPMIKNLIVDIRIHRNQAQVLGGIVDDAGASEHYQTYIENCTVKGYLRGHKAIGGIAGSANKFTHITNCKNEATLRTTNPDCYIGGIVGIIGGNTLEDRTTNIINCENSGEIIGPSQDHEATKTGTKSGYPRKDF